MLLLLWRPIRYDIIDFLRSPAVIVVFVVVASLWLLLRRGRYNSYEDYLRSPRWRELRREAMGRDGQRCRLCNCSDRRRLQVHHRRYADRWGNETVDDLTTLCDDCHSLVSHSEAQQRIYSR